MLFGDTHLHTSWSTDAGMIGTTVACLGITNTMIITVMERTRDIGIMKAVGASEGFIRLPFLSEGIFQSLLAGVLALGLWTFRRLKPGSAYDDLGQAARGRAQADWLVGMNLTRAYTVHNRVLCTIGRVQTPTLAMIVQRDQQIASFRKAFFYELVATLEEGVPVGVWTYWHPNGAECKKVTYKAGQPDGVVEYHNTEGVLEARRNFTLGKRTGKWESFNATGEQLLLEQHYQDGQPTGVWRSFWLTNGLVLACRS